MLASSTSFGASPRGADAVDIGRVVLLLLRRDRVLVADLRQRRRNVAQRDTMAMPDDALHG
jgi:hypothetical protein